MFDLRLLFVALAWGVNFPIIKHSLADFLPLSFTIVRFALASSALFGVLALRRLPFVIARRDIPTVAALGLTGITLYNLLFMKGLQLTLRPFRSVHLPVALFAAVLQTIRGRERMRAPLALGLLLATAGATASSGAPMATWISAWKPSPATADHLRFGPLGLLHVLAARCSSATACNIDRLERSRRDRTSRAGAAGDLMSQSWNTIQAGSWAALFFAALVGAAAAYVLWYEGVKRIGVTRTVVYHYLVPFVAVLVSSFFLGDAIKPLTAVGGIAIIGGVACTAKETFSS